MSLVIRDEQVAVFEEALRNDFIERLAAELKANYAEDVEPYTDEELYEVIDRGIDRAEDYGLEGDADISAFIKLLFTIGWYFDRYPMFQEILTNEANLPEEKMPFIFEGATDEDWEKAAALSDEELEKVRQAQESGD